MIIYLSCHEALKVRHNDLGTLKKLFKKVLTSQNDYGNLLWLSQRALLFEKNFLKKFLTKPRRYDNLSWLSKNSRTLIIEQWNT